MSEVRLSHIALGFGACLLIYGSLVGYTLCRKSQGSAHEIQSATLQGEAQTHAQTAQAIPDHAREIQSTKEDVARARAKVARTEQHITSKPGVPVSDPAGTGETMPTPVDSDSGSSVLDALRAERELTAAQDAQIKALEQALSDEQRRSAEFQAAYESERKATAAQAAATEAWKKAVTASRWQGRIEGFAAGAALGFLGGKR